MCPELRNNRFIIVSSEANNRFIGLTPPPNGTQIQSIGNLSMVRGNLSKGK
jgi:hypothetical protein